MDSEDREGVGSSKGHETPDPSQRESQTPQRITANRMRPVTRTKESRRVRQRC